MRLRTNRAFAFLVVIALARALSAQTTTSGGLIGVVTDPSGAVLPNANIEIKDDNKGNLQSTRSDPYGVYQFFFLAPSTYTLTVMHEGFQSERLAVNVSLGPPGTVNVALAIAKVNTEIRVTNEATLIQAGNGDASASTNQRQISEVPNPGNDLTYIVQTTPGVVMNTDSQSTGGIQAGSPNFSILGMPGSSYHFTTDGMSITDNAQNFVAGGSLGLTLGQNQIEETTVVSTGYSGQFGEAAGGNINYITKSGSNEFHGNAQYYWNGRVLNANDWFNKALGGPRPFSIANQWAGSFGGPISKDRVFFFADTEGLRLLIPQVFLVTIPSPQFKSATIANIDSRFGSTSASDAFYKEIFNLYDAAPGTNTVIQGGPSSSDPLGCSGFTLLGPNVPCSQYFSKTRGRPSQDALISGRLDYNIGKNDRAFCRLQGEQGFGAFSTDPISPVFDSDYDVSLWQGQLIETHAFGSRAASQLLLAGSEYDSVWRAKYPSQALTTFPTVLNFSVPGTFTGLGNGIGSYGRNTRQYQLSEDVVKIRGRHKLGFGVDLIRAYWHVPPTTFGTSGQLMPQTLNAFYQGGVDPASPSNDYTSLTQSFNSQSTIPVSFLRFQAYAQDEWHVRPALTFTLALRAEHYSNPLCESHCFARPPGPFEAISHDPDQPYNQAILTGQAHALVGLDNALWSPRFSFAWQPFGLSHSSVLRGGVGIFYDPLRDAISELFYLNAPVYNVYTAFADNLTPDETTSLFKDTSFSNAVFVNGFAAGKTLAQLQAVDPNFLPPALNSVERTMHLAQYQRWSLEWQQALGVNTSATIGYFGHHGIQETVVNPSVNAYGFASLPTGQCTSPPVPPCSDPRFSKVVQVGTGAMSNYNGIVFSFRHQFTRLGSGLLQVNYTYSHAFDQVSNGGYFGFTSGSSLYPQDPDNLRGAYGPAEYDVRHSLNGDYVWELPLKAALGGRGPDYLVKGWQVSGTIFARTGFPYTVFDSAESATLQQSNYYGAVYSVPVGPVPASSSCGRGAAFVLNTDPCLPPQFFEGANGSTIPNPDAFFVQAGCETGFNTGHLGASGVCDGPIVSFAQGRNRFRGPGYFNADFAIMKNTNVPGWEKATLGIGFQFFNLLNHPNFGLPDNWSSDANFGQIFYMQQSPTSILGSGLGGDAAPRMIQLKAQLRF
jgi:Carboxypeptidase regulatory-like domain